MILIKSSIELKQNSLTNFLLDFPKLEITNSFIELIENFSFSKISSFAFSTASELSSTLSKGIDFGAIFARSGLATKFGINLGNGVAMIDEDYTGEYIVALHNDSCNPVAIEKGDRIAQLVFLPYLNVEFTEAEELDITDRGDGGFGSTGK